MNFYYKKPDGEVVHVQRRFADGPPPETLELDGVTARRDYSAKAAASVPSTSGWPLTCVASGVNAEDAQKLRDHFKAVGVPTEVTRDGDPIYTDAAHRRRALKARGFVDRASFA